MARRVVLHVGTPKSGTTYLQRVLRSNQEDLRARGVLVAGRNQGELVHAGFVVREDPRLQGLPARASRAWERVVREVTAFDGGTAVISYELLAGARRRQAAAAIADLEAGGAEVHVVITCRDLGRAVGSAWQERLKFALTTPLEQWEPRPADAGPRAEWGWRTLDPAEVARRWGATLPPERVHIVTAPRSGPPTLLWDRFCSACGIDGAGLDLEVPAVNEALGVKAAEVLRRVNGHDLGPVQGGREQSRWLRDTLAHRVLAGLDDEPTTITAAQLAQARERARTAVAEIRDVGWSLHGDLDDLGATRREGRLPGDIPAEELLEVATGAVVALLLELRTATLASEDAVRASGGREATRGTGEDAGGTAEGRRRGRRSPRAVLAALRGDDVQTRLDTLERELADAREELQESRRLQERVAALTDLVQELLVPTEAQDRDALVRSLRAFRRESL